MPDVWLGVLGPLRAWRAGEPVEIPSGRQRRVLADLIVHAGSPVTADALVDATWPVDAPERPRAALYTVVSRLRALLGGEVIPGGVGGYRLDVPVGAIDAQEFDRLCESAGNASPARSAALLDEALALWRGAAYAEVADSEFATIEAQRLDERRLDAIERREHLRIEENDAPGAVAHLEPFVAANPYREHALELLMTSLYQSGRIPDALERYRDYRTHLGDELGLDPSPSLRNLEARILGHELPRTRASDAFGVPAWLDTSTAFVGRDEEQDRLCEAMAGSRLVTVTGTGGVGKTRLVAETLKGLCDMIACPAVVVELGSVHPGRVDAAVADAMRLRGAEGAIRTELLDYLAITDLLLVLDNCEHVLPEVAALVDEVVRRCPRVHVVATSRHRLGGGSEQVLTLAPLKVADADAGPERLRHSSAVRLLSDRVRRLRPMLSLSDDTVAVAADICRRLDGLPLALELAASSVATLGVRPVRERIAKSPMMLDDQVGNTPRRLADAMDWSYSLLSEDQRRLLALSSLFPGEFDLAAIEGFLTAARDVPKPASAATTLGKLVEASLLSVREVDGVARYRMLAVVRAFAQERLVGSGTSEAAHRAHANWIRGVTERAAEDSIGPSGADAVARLDTIRPSIAAAVRWAFGAGDLKLGGTITGSIALCSHWTPDLELNQLMVDVGQRCASTGPRSALAVGAAAKAMTDRGDVDGARELASLALELADEPRGTYLALLVCGVANLYAGAVDESVRYWRRIAGMGHLPMACRAEAAISLAFINCVRGDVDSARGEADRAMRLADESGAPAIQAFALYVTGETVLVRDPVQGLRIVREAAERAHTVHAEQVRLVAEVAALSALARQGERDEAVDLTGRLLHRARRQGAWPQLWTTMRILAELLARTRAEDAAFLLAATRASEGAQPLMGRDVRRYETLNHLLRERLGTPVLDRIAILARGMTRTQVLDRALTMVDEGIRT